MPSRAPASAFLPPNWSARPLGAGEFRSDHLGGIAAPVICKSDLSPIYTPMLEAGAEVLAETIKARLDLDPEFHV